MNTNTDHSITIIVRATGESTTNALVRQLKKQLTKQDCLHIIDKEECFEDKLKYGFELGIEQENDFTIFIDADILIRCNAIKMIRKTILKLEDTDLGFGLRLWDRFYDRPKFRGLHVYRTTLLSKAIKRIPVTNLQLRPESYTKQQLKEEGHAWRNGISLYVAGIHDFFQKAEDIYYKFVIRSKRSEKDIPSLLNYFKSNKEQDFKIALKGLEDGERFTNVINNKFLYKSKGFKLAELSRDYSYNKQSVDIIVVKKLLKYYGVKRVFWRSL